MIESSSRGTLFSADFDNTDIAKPAEEPPEYATRPAQYCITVRPLAGLLP